MNKKIKYYQIMELECNTPISNRSVGADFHYCKDSELDKVLKKIEDRENNYYVDEISVEDYEREFERIRKKNYYLATGVYLTD